MALNVGELFVTIGAVTTPLERGLDRATRRLDRFGSSATRAGRTLTIGFTTPVLGAAAATVKFASDAEETSSKFDVAFGSIARTSRQTVDQLADDMQRSRFLMQGMAADAQAILGPMVANREAAGRMSVALSALSVDLASYMNVAESDASQRLISGLLGSTEATERLGISLRESTLQLEAQRLGIDDNVAAMTDAEKIMLRFVSIMRQSADAQTDAVRTSASFANQMRALQADARDLAIEIGQELMPYALALIRWGRDAVGVLRDLSPETKETVIQIAALAATAGPAAIGLGAAARAAAVVGRSLLLLTRIAKANPMLLIAVGASALLLSVEEVQERIDNLFESLGMGRPFDAFDELSAALAEIQNLEFDPAAAQEESLQRLKDLYAEAVADIEAALRNGTVRIAGASEELRKAIEEALKVDGGGIQLNDQVIDALANAGALEAIGQEIGLRFGFFDRPFAADADLARMIAEEALAQGLITDEIEAQRVALEARRAELESQAAHLEKQLVAVESIDQSLIKTIDDQRAYRDTLKEITAEWLRARLEAQAVGREIESLDLQRIAVDFGLLQLRADAGTISIGDALAGLHQMQADLLALTQAQGGLANASEEQLRLWNAITRAIEEFTEAAAGVPDEIKRIIDELERRRGVGMALEREIARATGAEFDPIAFEMDALTSAIREMVDVTGEIPPEARPLIERLRELREQHQALTVQEAALSSVVSTLRDRLSEIDPALGGLVDSIEFDAAGMFTGFDMASLAAQGLAFGINVLLNAVDQGTAAFEATAARIRNLDPGTDSLAIAQRFRDFENIEANRQRAIAEAQRLRDLQNEIDRRTLGDTASGGALGIGLALLLGANPLLGLFIGGIAGGVSGHQRAQRDLGPEIAEAEAEIARLEEAIEGARVELIDALGIGADSFASGIQSALDSVSTDEFEANLDRAIDSVIRQGLIRTFIAEVIADDIQRIAQHVQEAMLGGGTPEEIARRIDTDLLEGAKAQIESEAEVLRGVFEQLGIAAEDLKDGAGDATRGLQEMSRVLNAPQGFVVSAVRNAAAIPELPGERIMSLAPTRTSASEPVGDITVNIYGATDPVGTAREVERVLRSIDARKHRTPIRHDRRLN